MAPASAVRRDRIRYRRARPASDEDARAGAGRALKLGGAADVVDVRVCMDDGVDREPELAYTSTDAFEVASRIDHDGTLGVQVREDGAVAA